jgi:capsular polysaccharide biosynthesis protein
MRVAARHWLVVVTCAVLGATVALWLALFVVTPSYSAVVKLYVSGRGTTADDRVKNGEYARTHISSYADLVTSKDVLQAVRESLGLPTNSASSPMAGLASNITASNPLSSMIIDVTVEDPSPERARAVADAIGDATNSVVARLESPAGEQQSPVRITTVSPPALPTAQTTPSRKLYAGAGLLAGSAAGAGVACLLELRRKRRRQLEAHSSSDDSWSWGPVSAPASIPVERKTPLHVLKSQNARASKRKPAEDVKSDEPDASGF